MSRRDTIIIAVLLNAGLLIVLFATSLKSDKAEDEPSAITVLASNQSEAKDVRLSKSITPVVVPSTHDQVDRVIEQYVTPQVVTSEQQNLNFLADLQAIGTPFASSESTGGVPQQFDASEGSYKEVKVSKGDVLERIARQNHVSVSEIMKANNLTSTRLKIGQVLKIPTNGVPKTTSAVTVAGAQYYTIKAGDNPWTIAIKHHMKVEDLLKLNNIDEQKAKRLKAGDKIRIN